MNIWVLHSNVVDCESFLESNSPGILALCETNLDDSIDSGDFSVRGHLTFWKDSSIHMHRPRVYLKEGLPFTWDLNSADSYLCFRLWLLTSLSVLLLFSLFCNRFPYIWKVSVSIDFPSYSQEDAPFYHIAYAYSHADWGGLCDHLRDVPWEDIFKLSASAAASEFCEGVQVGIDIWLTISSSYGSISLT